MDEHIPISPKEQLLLLKFNISQKTIDAFNSDKDADIKDIYIKASVDALLYKHLQSRHSNSLRTCFLAILKKSPCRGTEDFDNLIKLKVKRKKKVSHEFSRIPKAQVPMAQVKNKFNHRVREGHEEKTE